MHIFLTDIRYCALLSGLSWNELVVFAGTVFQQILVWAPANLEKETVDSPVLHTLRGHDVCHSLLLIKELIKVFNNRTCPSHHLNIHFIAHIS
jgi:hypothetical protein